MHHDRFPRIAALAGVGAGIALAGGLALTFNSPSSDAPSVAEISDWYGSHELVILLSSLLCAPLYALLLLFFASGLRSVLRSGEAGEASYSTVVSVAAGAVAVATLLMAAADAAAMSAAGEGEAEIARTIYMASHFSWIVWAAPCSAFLLATGIGGLRTSFLPRALAWASVVLGVLALTPAGIAVFLLLPLWLIVTGAIVYRRQSATAAASGAVLATGD